VKMQSSPHPVPSTAAFIKGWSLSRERRVSRSLASGRRRVSGGQHVHAITCSCNTPVISFEHLNWVATDPLPRDQKQSRRLYEPEYRINTMTGDDIENVTTHPSLADGNLTIYFETNATCTACINMPVDHPSLHLTYPATTDNDRGG